MAFYEGRVTAGQRGQCEVCETVIDEGEVIYVTAYGWVHVGCATAVESADDAVWTPVNPSNWMEHN